MTLTDAAITPDGRFVAVVAGTNGGVDSAANVAHVWDLSKYVALPPPTGRRARQSRLRAARTNFCVSPVSVSTTQDQTWQTVLCIWQLPGGELARIGRPSDRSLARRIGVGRHGDRGSRIHGADCDSRRRIVRAEHPLGSDLGVDRLAISDDGRTLIAACHRAETSVPFVGESNADSVRRMKQAMRNDPFWDGVDLYQESGKGDGFGLRIWNVDTGELQQHSIDGAHRERISMLQPVAGDASYLPAVGTAT